MAAVACACLPGKGVSSSAAVEVATMRALLGAVGVEVADGRWLARLCQKVENNVSGVMTRS
jgi:L-arabinokinase